MQLDFSQLGFHQNPFKNPSDIILLNHFAVPMEHHLGQVPLGRLVQCW